MSGAKLMVMYPPPKDLDAFERAYSNDHIPMAAPIFQAAGATKAVFSKATGSPTGVLAFHRIAEIHFPSLATVRRSDRFMRQLSSSRSLGRGLVRSSTPASSLPQ